MKWILCLLLATQVLAAEDLKPTFETKRQEVHAMGLIKKDLPRAPRKTFKDFAVEIPNSLDLRPSLSQIENQGNCGSCWAFSLTASLRDGYVMNQADPGRLSQQYLVDCAQNESGCGGGYFDAADYFINPKGAPSLADYPYTARDGRCQSHPGKAHIVSWAMLGGGNGPSVKDIEAYMVASHKPVSITVAAGAGSWGSYSSGIYNGCRSAGTDHMINIVGFDNEGLQLDSSGNLPAGKGIWILRNSWGTGWGEDGYMRSKMTDSSGRKCNSVAEEAAVYAFDNEPVPSPTPSPIPTPTPTPIPPTPEPDVNIPFWMYVGFVGGIVAVILLIVGLIKKWI